MFAPKNERRRLQRLQRDMEARGVMDYDDWAVSGYEGRYDPVRRYATDGPYALPHPSTFSASWFRGRNRGDVYAREEGTGEGAQRYAMREGRTPMQRRGTFGQANLRLSLRSRRHGAGVACTYAYGEAGGDDQ